MSFFMSWFTKMFETNLCEIYKKNVFEYCLFLVNEMGFDKPIESYSARGDELFIEYNRKDMQICFIFETYVKQIDVIFFVSIKENKPKYDVWTSTNIMEIAKHLGCTDEILQSRLPIRNSIEIKNAIIITSKFIKENSEVVLKIDSEIWKSILEEKRRNKWQYEFE